MAVAPGEDFSHTSIVLDVIGSQEQMSASPAPLPRAATAGGGCGATEILPQMTARPTPLPCAATAGGECGALNDFYVPTPQPQPPPRAVPAEGGVGSLQATSL